MSRYPIEKGIEIPDDGVTTESFPTIIRSVGDKYGKSVIKRVKIKKKYIVYHLKHA